jgi:succinate-semialdehyde dehydrogenase/glutarate-semialdehyde dehydrogenase
MAIESINPANGKRLRRFAQATRAAINTALERAASTAADWRAASLDERRNLLSAAAHHLREGKVAYGELMALEMGKPITQAIAEVEKCAWTCDYFAQQAATMLADEAVPTEATRSFVSFEPLGVVLAVMPWNFPFWQVFRFAAPALMAGNVAILKHASNVPQCALAIEDVFRRAGLPRGVFQTLLVGSQVVERLIADARIAAVTITGSEPAGVQVATTAGHHLKKVVLELGGADPFIVLADADLEATCRMAAQARVVNSGQSCIAAKRFIVDRAIAPAFAAGFVEQMQALRVGDPLDPATQVGPLARGDLLAELEEQVRRSVRRGARVLTGGHRIAGHGFFYEPTVLGDVRPGMPAYDEEVFGPVASLIVADDEEDAIRIANDSRFGLGASLWTRDFERGLALARRVASGVVFVNDMVKSDPRLPFGGIKKSGYGRELASYGLKEFTNIKTIVAF